MFCCRETLYVDPVREEERHASLSVTVVTSNDISDTAVDSDNICVIHKTGKDQFGFITVFWLKVSSQFNKQCVVWGVL